MKNYHFFYAFFFVLTEKDKEEGFPLFQKIEKGRKKWDSFSLSLPFSFFLTEAKNWSSFLLYQKIGKGRGHHAPCWDYYWTRDAFRLGRAGVAEIVGPRTGVRSASEKSKRNTKIKEYIILYIHTCKWIYISRKNGRHPIPTPGTVRAPVHPLGPAPLAHRRVRKHQAEARPKIAGMALTAQPGWNWSSFQLASSTPPLNVPGSARAPSARTMSIGQVAYHTNLHHREQQ